MPISAGLLQQSIVTLGKPIVSLDSIVPDGYTDCGNQISFVASVSYTLPFSEISMPINDGYIAIRDNDTNEVLGVGAVSANTASISTSTFDGYRHIHAFFTGIPNLLYSAKSDSQPYYTIKATVDISSVSSHTVFAGQDGYVVFDFTTTNPYVTISGTVEYRLYSNYDAYVSLASSTITAGQSTAMIPANTMAPNATYYLSAIYLGTSCISLATNGLGLSGFQINST